MDKLFYGHQDRSAEVRHHSVIDQNRKYKWNAVQFATLVVRFNKLDRKRKFKTHIVLRRFEKNSN